MKNSQEFVKLWTWNIEQKKLGSIYEKNENTQLPQTVENTIKSILTRISPRIISWTVHISIIMNKVTCYLEKSTIYNFTFYVGKSVCKSC